jgi:hypothetical protein
MRRTLALVVAALLSAGIRAADPPLPQLTEVQRLTLQTHVLAYQLAQVRLESAVKDLTVPGYVLDLQKLEYVKAPEKETPK